MGPFDLDKSVRENYEAGKTGLRDGFNRVKQFGADSFQRVGAKMGAAKQAADAAVAAAPPPNVPVSDPGPVSARSAPVQASTPVDEFTRLYDPARLKSAGYNATAEQAGASAARAAPGGGVPPAEPVAPAQPAAPRAARPITPQGTAAYDAAALQRPQTVVGDPTRVPTASAQEIAAARGPGGIRGAFNTAGKLMKGLGIAGGVVAGADAVDKAMEGNTVEQRAGGNALQGAAAEFGDSMLLGQGRAAGTALAAGTAGFMNPGVQDQGLMGRVRSGFRMAGEGWDDAKAAERAASVPVGAKPPAAPAAPAGRNAENTMEGRASAAGSETSVNGGKIPTLRGGNVTPADLMKGTEAPVAGTGAFQRKGGQAVGLDTRSAPVQAEGPQRPKTFVGAVAGFKTKQYEDNKKASAEKRAIDQQKANATTATAVLARQQDNRKVVEQRVKDSATRDPEILKLDPKERESAIAQRAADTSARLDYSLGRRKAEKGHANPAAVNDFLDADKWRKAIETSRGGVQQLRDMIGDKQFDSQDSFSYRPAYKDKSGRIYSENGNNIGHNDSWRQSNWFAPNKVDADMKRYVDNLPTKEEYEAAQKGKK